MRVNQSNPSLLLLCGLLCVFSVVIIGCDSKSRPLTASGEGAVSAPTNGFLGITLVDPAASPLVIEGFVPKSPAEISGLQKGDVLLRVDRQRDPTYDQLNEIVQMLNPGDMIGIRIQRGENELEYRVELVGYDFIQNAMDAQAVAP